MRSKRFHRDRSLAVIICLVSTGRPGSGPFSFTCVDPRGLTQIPKDFWSLDAMSLNRCRKNSILHDWRLGIGNFGCGSWGLKPSVHGMCVLPSFTSRWCLFPSMHAMAPGTHHCTMFFPLPRSKIHWQIWQKSSQWWFYLIVWLLNKTAVKPQQISSSVESGGHHFLSQTGPTVDRWLPCPFAICWLFRGAPIYWCLIFWRVGPRGGEIKHTIFST